MTSAWDIFQQRIQEELEKKYTKTVIDHANNPRNLGKMEGHDGYGRITGPCGDTMEFWVRVKENIILETRFRTTGCGTSRASGSMATELATGKTTAEAAAISQQDILDALGGLPEDGEHCALLASNTLKAAIQDYRDMEREPWKRAYRT